MPGDIYTLLKNQHVFGTLIVVYSNMVLTNFFIPALFRNLAVYPCGSLANVYIARGSTMSCTLYCHQRDKLIGSVVCVYSSH